MTEPSPEPPAATTKWLRRAPFLLILLGALAGLVFFRHYLSFDVLAQNRAALIAIRDANYLLAVLAFMGLYVLVVVFSVPGSLFLTLSGGFLFGVFPGALYNVGAATLGATVLFLAARAGFGRDVAAQIAARGGVAARLQAGLKENEWSVLLTMRLIPVIPFFLSNLLPAFVGVRLSVFVITTFLGIIPAAVIYTALGAGLGEVFARGEVPHLNILLTPRFALPLLGLACLAALPLVLKLFGKKRA